MTTMITPFRKELRRSFQTHYQLNEEALKFFSVHTVADIKHSQLAARLVSDLARTPEQQEQVRSVLTRLWDLQQRQLDELVAA
jgi:pyrroloquinoline quinone (PQQ) biosynthesis protein C